MTDRGRHYRTIRHAATFTGGMFAGAVALAAYTARALNGPRRRDWRDGYTFTPWELGVDFAPVDFVAEDGVTLRGWWLPRAGTDRVVIASTGHRGLKTDLLGIGSGLWRAGNNVLLYDFRGCGESDLVPLSVGFHEQRDLRAAVRYARARVAGARLGLMGYSMGAALSLLVAAEDDGILAVVADSAFATLSDVVAAAYGRRRLPASPLIGLSDRYNGWRYGYRYGALRPIDAVGQLAPRPLLIIHGSQDNVTPVEHAHRLYAAAGEPKELWIAKGVQHCGAYFFDREHYVARIAAFFAHALS